MSEEADGQEIEGGVGGGGGSFLEQCVQLAPKPEFSCWRQTQLSPVEQGPLPPSTPGTSRGFGGSGGMDVLRSADQVLQKGNGSRKMRRRRSLATRGREKKVGRAGGRTAERTMG